MPLNAGSVATGGAGTGLAKALYDAYKAKFTPPPVSPSDQPIVDLCNAFAGAIVDHFKNNGEVTIMVAVADVGLQTSTAVGAPTGPPAAPVVLATKGTIA